MKLKNDNVRKKIVEEATKEFFHSGYKDASIRTIAANANITPGNIYRYYESKEALLDAVVGDVHKKISLITKMKFFDFTKMLNNQKKINFIFNEVMEYVTNVRYELLILLNKSEGSKYEKFACEVCEITAQTIDKTLTESNIELSRVFANAAIYAVLNIIETHMDNPEKIKSLSFEFLCQLFGSTKFGQNI